MIIRGRTPGPVGDDALGHGDADRREHRQTERHDHERERRGGGVVQHVPGVEHDTIPRRADRLRISGPHRQPEQSGGRHDDHRDEDADGATQGGASTGDLGAWRRL